MKQPLTHRQLSQMMNDIDMGVFAIRSRLASFTAALLHGVADRAAAIDLPVVCGECSRARIVRCGCVYLDPNHGLILVTDAGGGEDVPWDELTLASQHLIAQDLTTRYLAGDIYGART